MSDEDQVPRIHGERDNSLRVGLLSAQSRVSNVLAIGLMSVLGLGALTWYYANAMMRQERAKENAAAASAKELT